jgi:hypothetical protein
METPPSFATGDTTVKRKITFDREGLTLVGDVFTPDGFDESGHYQALIVQGSHVFDDAIGRSTALRIGRRQLISSVVWVTR